MKSKEPRSSILDHIRNPLVVVLVTPAHLTLIEDGNVFIPNLLDQEIGPYPQGQEVDVLAAVVDRISHADAVTDEANVIIRATSSNVFPKPTRRDGSEGISVAFLDSNSAVPSLWSERQGRGERETMTIQQRCTLTFMLPSSILANRGIQMSEPQQSTARMLQLPVTSTVFLNGRTATLFAQRWSLQPKHSPGVQWTLNRATWLPQQALKMSGLVAKEVFVDHSLHSDLIAITPTRVITAAIGNIIRKVSAGGSPQVDVPASEELERAINDGMNEGSPPDQPAGVWALVCPQEHTALEGSVAVRMGSGPDQLQHAILSGCRLHKVLGGGGGWGEKQGLLALDPDSDYSPAQQAFQSISDMSQDAEVQKLQALGQAVKPGDMVTFYVRGPSLAQADTMDPSPSSAVSNYSVPLSLTFGALPSTMDVMPDPLQDVDGLSQVSDCVFLEGRFGMFSEQGMSLTVSLIILHIDRALTSTFSLHSAIPMRL